MAFWEIEDGSGAHFLAPGGTPDLADLSDPSRGPARVTGTVALLRAPAGASARRDITVRCTVRDGRTRTELATRRFTVITSPGAAQATTGSTTVEASADLPAGLRGECAVSFANWRHGAGIDWTFRICDDAGQGPGIVVAEGDHALLDAATLFGEAIRNDTIEARAGHPDGAGQTLRIPDRISYLWQVEVGLAPPGQPAFEGLSAAFTAPFLHSEDGPSEPEPSRVASS